LAVVYTHLQPVESAAAFISPGISTNTSVLHPASTSHQVRMKNFACYCLLCSGACQLLQFASAAFPAVELHRGVEQHRTHKFDVILLVLQVQLQMGLPRATFLAALVAVLLATPATATWWDNILPSGNDNNATQVRMPA
jgi:hypothetical protein